MRNAPPFACPLCGDGSLAAVACLRCRVPVLDVNGNPPLAPRAAMRVPRPWKPVSLAGVAATVGLLALAPTYAPIAVGLTLAAIAVLHHHDLRGVLERREHESELAAVRRAAPTVTPIADATAGVVRVRGRVRVLEPAPGARGPKIAAFRRPERSQIVETIETRVESRLVVESADLSVAIEGEGRTVTFELEHGHVTEHAACGRFLVDDGTGLALVDDDAFVLEPPSGMSAARAVTLSHGDAVEVIGPARREPLPPEHRSAGSYRAAPTWLRFDGTLRARVILRPIAGGGSPVR